MTIWDDLTQGCCHLTQGYYYSTQGCIQASVERTVGRELSVADQEREGGVLEFVNLSVLVPILLSVMANYGFYPSGRFSEESFRATYEHGIWRYRVLGREAVLALDNAFSWILPADFGLRTQTLYASLPDYSPRFFFSLFVFNTIFLIATAALLNLAIGIRPRARYGQTKVLLSVLLVCLMVISGFKVTPYDNLGYACLCAAVLLTGKRWTLPLGHLLACLVIIVVGTASRESMALFLSFRFALALHEHGWRALWSSPKLRAFRIQFALLISAFLVTYLGLRLVLGRFEFINAWSTAGLLRPATFIGLAWALSLGFVVARVAWSPRFLLYLLVCSAPYLLTIFLAADLYELRLYVPLLLLIAMGSEWTQDPLGRPYKNSSLEK